MPKRSITKEELKQWIRAGKGLTIIDVRTPEVYNIAHVPGSVNIPLIDILEDRLQPERSHTIITICGKGGGRSEQAFEHLKQKYPSSVYFLEGGTNAWFDD